MSLLEVDNLSVNYGAIEAIRDCSLRVEQGEIVTLIGGNGAGKSTTLRTISGLLTPKNGTIRFDGQTIHGRAPHAITQSGLIHVPEGRGIFANLTVEENLMLGAYSRNNLRDILEDREMALNLFPRVRERLVQLQRDIGRNGSMVTEGRDQGTVVFSDAEHKFFVTANLEARARRRQRELAHKGVNQPISVVMDELRQRDERDESRAHAPMKPAKDAIVIDTSDLTIAQVVDMLAKRVRRT